MSAFSKPHTATVAAACAALMLGVTPIAVAGPGALAAPRSAEAPHLAGEVAASTLTLSSRELSVAVSSAFPQVVKYTDNASGANIFGRSEPLDSVVLNDTAYDVNGSARQVDHDTVSYELTFPDLDGVTMQASLDLDGRVTTFAVDAINDTADFRVGPIDIPGHDLMAVRSDQPGATVATAIVSADRTRSGDTITPVTAQTPADDAPKGSAYAIVNTDELAAAMETNSTYDEKTGPAVGDNGRIWRQANQVGGRTEVGLWSGQWTYRARGASFTEDLPWAKVVVTPDANDDETLDWQDGAVAFRDIAINPKGAEETPDRVVTHIPFNFASQATHPFLRVLDDVKRISLSTDGLGQLAVLKGYASEGHDSAHPDYGGNYNKRAGGLDDLNTLVDAGEKWGADFGVHVNATEAYPVADSFSDELVDEDSEGWNWLDQSYYIDQRRDLTSGDIVDRFGQLRRQAHPNLDFLYIDVYYSYGWLQERLAKELADQGWQIGTEWAYHFEEQSLWSHWANDENYGGATNKGLNSYIIRFVRNGQKDVWNPDPILGHTEIREFEGWTGEVDWNAFYDNIWQNNLPAKYLQHHEIIDWNSDDIRFTGGVRATDDGGRAFFDDGKQVLDGDTYLLPWKADRGPWKLYHYNRSGGRTSWQLTDRFAHYPALAVSRLTDQGRERVARVPVRNGEVTLEAAAQTPHVVTPLQQAGPPSSLPVKWGEASHVADPGFNAGNLDAWHPTGAADVERNARGQYEAVLQAGGSASVSQRITGLTPGTWAANVQVEVQPGESRRTTIEVDSGGTTASNYVERSTAKNWVAADEKHGSYLQLVETRFDVPAGADSAQLEISAAAGDARVTLDNVRVVKTKGPRPGGGIVSEDFEDVTQGWYPFVKGDAGGVTDPRTHIAQRHAPYTQSGWNAKLVDDVIDGEESLKAHEENAGLVYRTVPQTVRFEPGHRYRVSFDYQSGRADAYQWVTGYDSVRGGEPRSVEVDATPVGEVRATERFSQNLVAGECGDYWVGLRKPSGGGSQADLIMDNFTVEDLGTADATPACGSLDITTEEQKLKPGVPNDVTTSFTSDEAGDATDLSMALGAPAGWRVEATSPSNFARVAPGESVDTVWSVTPPADSPTGPHALEATVGYDVDESERTLSETRSVETVPAAPTSDMFASDQGWVSASNGWGPVEQDTANGESAGGDGPPITLNGVVYDKGLGAHAPSRVRFYLDGNCQRLVSDVGIDDYQTSRGSIVFDVLADGRSVAKSPVMRPDSTTYAIDADISGAQYVDLVVGDAGDGNGNDHADWAGARFHCTG